MASYLRKSVLSFYHNHDVMSSKKKKKGYRDKISHFLRTQQQMDACGQPHTLVTLFLWKVQQEARCDPEPVTLMTELYQQ